MKRVDRRAHIALFAALAMAVAGLALGCGQRSDGGGSACRHAGAEWVVTVEPTCYDNGQRQLVCGDCGQVLEEEDTLSLGCDYPSEGYVIVTYPTEQKWGERIMFCGRDVSHYAVNTIPNLTENAYTVQERAATCAEVGKAVYSSDRNGTYTVYTPKLEHDWSTADADGKCHVCDSKISSLGLGFTLNEAGDGYIVSKSGSYADVDLVIPEYHNGLPVTEIANDAFAEWKWITSVSIPKTIKRIGAGAFSQMSGIRSVYFNAQDCDDLNGRNWAFLPAVDGSSSPIEVVIGSAARRIPARLFFPLALEPENPAKVTKLSFEEGSVCSEIGEYAFYHTPLTECDIPMSVKRIGAYAFTGTKLVSVGLEYVAEIGEGAFKACELLQSVRLGPPLAGLGSDAFSYCYALTAVDLRSCMALDKVGRDAFKGCRSVTSVILPNALAAIGRGAFEGCTSVQKVVQGKELASIGARAFFGCSALDTINITSNVTELGDSAFEGCTAVSKIVFDAEACADLAGGNRVFACVGSVNVVIGKNVSRLPERLFYSSADSRENIYILSLDMPSTVTEVGKNAFLGVSAADGVSLPGGGEA